MLSLAPRVKLLECVQASVYMYVQKWICLHPSVSVLLRALTDSVCTQVSECVLLHALTRSCLHVSAHILVYQGTHLCVCRCASVCIQA